MAAPVAGVAVKRHSTQVTPAAPVAEAWAEAGPKAWAEISFRVGTTGVGGGGGGRGVTAPAWGGGGMW